VARPLTLTRVARGAGLVLLAVAMLALGAWCVAAVWYHAGGGQIRRIAASGAAGLFVLAAIAGVATRRRKAAVGVYAAAAALFFAWWSMITPSNDRDWGADVARLVSADIDGDRIVVHNVRNFTWRSDADFDPVWEDRHYALSAVKDVDLIMSYWMGEAIAHTIVSFGFVGGERLDFSIETRKETDERYSSIAGFFKEYELAIVAADERDVVRVRSNIRGEDVRLYRLRIDRRDAQRLLIEYLDAANELARHPRFYNTLTANCTSLVFDMVRVIHPGLPLDLRVILAGYLPDYAYAQGATVTDVPFEKLRALSRIHDKALRADSDPDFSAKIREGIPQPH
jgi:hypothetical protein